MRRFVFLLSCLSVVFSDSCPPEKTAVLQYFDGSNWNDLFSALALARQLERFDTQRQQAIAIDARGANSAFQGWFYNKLLGVKVVYSDTTPVWEIIDQKHMRGLWRDTFGRLVIYNATDFCRFVNVDPDTLVLRNMDDYFEHRAPGFTQWTPFLYNIGVGVLEPSEALFDSLLDALKIMVTGNNINIARGLASKGKVDGKFLFNFPEGERPDPMSINGLGLQGFINAFWKHKSHQDQFGEVMPLPSGYNLRSDDIYFTGQLCYLPYFVRFRRLTEISIVHFTPRKPLALNLTKRSTEMELLRTRTMESSLHCIYLLSVDEMWRTLDGDAVLESLTERSESDKAAREIRATLQPHLADEPLTQEDRDHFRAQLDALTDAVRKHKEYARLAWDALTCRVNVFKWHMPPGTAPGSSRSGTKEDTRFRLSRLPDQL